MRAHAILNSFYYEHTPNKDAQIKVISILCFNTNLIMWVFGATFKFKFDVAFENWKEKNTSVIETTRL